MNIFISWSGEMSRIMAKRLGELLSAIMPELTVHIPSAERYGGIGWFAEELKEIKRAHLAILSLTRESLQAPWLLFETGALADRVGRDNICPVLFDLSVPDLSGPLAQFKAYTTEKEDLHQLARMVHKKIGKWGSRTHDEPDWTNLFNQSWPEFQSAVLSYQPEPPRPRLRSDRAVLYEILELSRVIARFLDTPETQEIDPPLVQKTIEPDPSNSVPSALHERDSLSELAKLAKELFVAK